MGGLHDLPQRNTSGTDDESTLAPQRQDPGAWFCDVLLRNRESRRGGVYSVCSAHPAVVEAAVRQCLEGGSLLLVESTASQVNQFGGYTGMTPAQFAQFIYSTAERAGLPAGRVLLGSDHAGPFPWRVEPSTSALLKGCALVRDCVLAGYQKIHFDASMPCADDGTKGLHEKTVAERAAILCQAAEEAFRELPSGSPQLKYVIGTEVPSPGGESAEGQAPAVTKAVDVGRTLEAFRLAFVEQGLSSAWEKVIAIVVQPGVEFGSNVVFDYDRVKTQSLSAALSQYPGIVYEAHSTDYQSVQALTQMVEDHFAILKVGPWLTFAFREAVLALSAIKRELLATSSTRALSQVREALDAAMLANPVYWQSYYHGKEDEVRRERIYSYSDRCRYYWNQPVVKEQLGRLFENLATQPIPLTLMSQYLPLEYEAIRNGQIQTVPDQVIQYHIRRVLQTYANACSAESDAAPKPAHVGTHSPL